MATDQMLRDAMGELREAQARIAELEAAQVPREPTEEMIDAARTVEWPATHTEREVDAEIWRAMYDAAHAAKDGKE